MGIAQALGEDTPFTALSASEIFSLEIRLYSLSYIAGILIGWLLAKNLFIKDNTVYEIYKENSTAFPRPPLVMECNWGSTEFIIIFKLLFYVSPNTNYVIPRDLRRTFQEQNTLDQFVSMFHLTD